MIPEFDREDKVEFVRSCLDDCFNSMSIYLPASQIASRISEIEGRLLSNGDLDIVYTLLAKKSGELLRQAWHHCRKENRALIALLARKTFCYGKRSYEATRAKTSYNYFRSDVVEGMLYALIDLLGEGYFSSFKTFPQKLRDLLEEWSRLYRDLCPEKGKAYAFYYFQNGMNLIRNLDDVKEEDDPLGEERIGILARFIVSFELANRNRKDSLIYQGIGRACYSLQHLIEEGPNFNRLESIIDGALSCEAFKESRYNGTISKLAKILKWNSDDVNVGRREGLWLLLDIAKNAFENAAAAGDIGPDNRSYLGMCGVDRARINTYLNKMGKKECIDELTKSWELLTEALERRILDEDEKVSPQDFRRVAEAEFRLGRFVEDMDVCNGLYSASIIHNKTAADMLGGDTNAQVYSFIASSYFKLARLAADSGERRRLYAHAAANFTRAQRCEEPDTSAECASKRGSCLLNLLGIEMKRSTEVRVIDGLIRKTRNALEDAVGKGREGAFVYPYFLLGFLAKRVSRAGRELSEYGLRCLSEYVKIAVNSYSENNPHWSVRDVGKRSKNWVYSPLDNHGLLEPFIVLKRGKFGELNRESENSEEISKRLEERLGKNRRFFTPYSIDILWHSDTREEMSGTYYVMRKAQGDVLEDVLSDSEVERDTKIDILSDIVDYMAFIHNNLTTEKREFQHESFIKDRLRKLGVKEEIIDTIAEHYIPIRRSLECSVYVFYKDSHSRNWIVGNRRRNSKKERIIIGLDWETKDLCPAELDIACLLDFTDFTYEEKSRLIEKYNESYRRYSDVKREEEPASMFRYLNITVPRAIQVLSWPTISLEQKIKMLERSIENIKQIELLDHEFYKRFSEDYESLKRGIEQLIAFLRSKSN